VLPVKMSKRGLSAEAKADKITEVFHETQDVFVQKQVETLASKKGVVTQSVKGFLDELTSSDIVQSDKIGIQNYYWAFPSTVANNIRVRLEDINTDIEKLKAVRNDLNSKLEHAKIGREETAERPAKIARLEKLQKRNAEIKDAISKYADNDPEILDIIEHDSKVAIEAANRWTDNIWEIKKWCVNKFNMDGKEIEKNWGIPEDFDYVT